MCTKQIQMKSKIKIMNTHYSFKCDTCKEKHTLMKTNPIQLCCIKHDDHELAKSWNRASMEFCSHCLCHKIGRNTGFVWFCNNCAMHNLDTLTGKNISIHDEHGVKKNGGKFIRCPHCTALTLTFFSAEKAPHDKCIIWIYSAS